MKRIFFIIALIFIFSLTYAVFRYNVFGDVPWRMLPLYVVNKAFAVSGLVLLMIIYLLPLMNREGGKGMFFWEHRSLLGRVTFVFILMHTVASLLLFKPAIYSKFFDLTGVLNVEGSLSMLFGLLSLATVWFINRLYHPDAIHHGEIRLYSRLLLVMIIIFIILHLVFMGYSGWLNSSDWPASLPPISMLSVIIIVVFVFYYQVWKTRIRH